MTLAPRPSEPKLSAHDRVYRGLRNRIMLGQMLPGESLTVRAWETGDGEATFQTTGDDGRVVLDAGKLTYDPI